jgi:branched-chain amino acid aminotransferase
MSVPSRATHAPAFATAIWVDGQRQQADELHISVRDRGFTLADGVFETMRVRNGRVFRLDRHLSRLADALARLSIPSVPDLKDWLLAAVRASSPDDASVRLTVTRGVGPAGVAPPLEARPTVVVSVNTLPSFPASVYTAGLTAHIASGRRNERAMTAGLKTLAYTDVVAGLLEAQRTGADEALFLDTEEHCSEATSSNVFVWTGNTLVTPPLSCAVLPGITRAAVLELANTLGITATERAFATDDLFAATESFLTSSLRGIAPLVRVGARAVGDGVPGPVTRQLTDAYRALVERECAR